MGHATSSLTAAGSSAASSLTAAGGSDQEQTRAPVTSSLTKDWWSRPTYEDIPVEWPTQDESFNAWLKSDSGKPDPPVAAPDQQPHGGRPEMQLGSSGPSSPPVVSSLTAADDKFSGYSLRALCRKHADKTYDQLVNEVEKFDPVTAATKYNFNMWRSTDPIGKQLTTDLN